MRDSSGGIYKDPYIKSGDRIRLISMEDDPQPVEPGTEGTVTSISDLGRDGQVVGVKWDNGRTLNVIPGADEYEIIRESKDAKVSVPKSKQSKSSKKFSKNFKNTVGKKLPGLRFKSGGNR
jgi:hypothetical protein